MASAGLGCQRAASLRGAGLTLSPEAFQHVCVGLVTHTNVRALTVLFGPLPGSGVVLGSRATTSWCSTAPRRGRVMVPLRCGPIRVPTGSPLQAAAVAPLKQYTAGVAARVLLVSMLCMGVKKPGTPAGALGAPVRAAPHQHLLLALTGVGQAPGLSLAVSVPPPLPIWLGVSTRVGRCGAGWGP